MRAGNLGRTVGRASPSCNRAASAVNSDLIRLAATLDRDRAARQVGRTEELVAEQAERYGFTPQWLHHVINQAVLDQGDAGGIAIGKDESP